jgi:CelD/BcsL family acetyltransferase involved in cellulose biosynthesis
MLIEEVTSIDDLVELAPEWDRLYRRASTATPFQSPGWLIPLSRSFQNGDLRVLAIYSGGRLAAVLPLVLQDSKLSFLGASITDYQDVLLDQEPSLEFLSLLKEYLSAHGCVLDGLRGDSALRPIAGKWLPVNTSPVISLPRTTAKYEQSLSKHFRKNLDHAWANLQKMGNVVVRLSGSNDGGSLLQRLFELHRQRWAERYSQGVLSSPDIRKFHRDVLNGLMVDGHLRLYSLQVNEEVVAVLYLLWDAQAAYYYIGGFSPNYAQFSPSSLIIRHVIHECIRGNMREFHFLRGAEAYKYRWLAEDRPLYRLVIRAGCLAA